MNSIIFKTILLKGDSGNSIKDITKTSTDGLIDTYTVTLTDGSTTTFEVTNGNGIESIEKTSTVGLTDIYTITLENGDTYTFDVVNGDNVEVDDALSTTSENPVQNKVITEYLNSICDLIYPVGSIYMSVNNVNPSTLFGGTWESWGSGRVPVGVNTSDSDFNTVEKTGGSKSQSYTPAGTNSGGSVSGHTLTVNEIPSHYHNMGRSNQGGGRTDWGLVGAGAHGGNVALITGAGGSTSTTSAGSGWSHDHGFTQPTFNGTATTLEKVQPYITCYMWKRTA